MKKGAVLGCTVFLFVFIGLLATGGDLVGRRVIVITNDHEFTVENGVCSGSGTVEDPYVVENWSIDAGLDDYGIRIHGTTRTFVIRNVEISGAAKSGIYFSYVQNGTIENCTLEANWTGVTLNFSSFNRITGCLFAKNTDAIHTYFSHNNQVLGSVFEQNDTALWLDASNESRISGNLISDSHMGVYFNLGSEQNTVLNNAFVDNLHDAYTDDPNLWDDGIRGNYWSGFSGIDADEDGIWDLPYLISSDGDQDNFPLVSHTLVPEPPDATCEEP
ncbi:MAG: NosD domain-containing protein [Candidatus Bipolaricaulia bacterium]